MALQKRYAAVIHRGPSGKGFDLKEYKKITLVGGSAASTSGGIKVFCIYYLLRAIP